MVGSPPKLHTMDSRSACVQGVLKVKVKVKGHLIRALSWILGMSYSVIDGKARGYDAYVFYFLKDAFVVLRTLTYSILAYVNMNRTRTQTMIAETANWFFATVLINLLFDFVMQNGQLN